MSGLLQLLLPPKWLPMNRPAVPEYLNVLYNFTAPLLLLKVADAAKHNQTSLVITMSI